VKLDAWAQPGTFPPLEGPALLEAVAELCERRQALVLATPYLTFGSRFTACAGQVLTVRATMSRNVARHTLDLKPLTLRFPWGATLYGGPSRLLDYLQDDTGRHLQVALPSQFTRSELRGAYRGEQTGRTSGTLGGTEPGPPGPTLLVRFNLENLSTSGMAVFCTDPLPGSAFTPGRTVTVAFALERGPALKATARVIHTNGQTLGLAFLPPLAGEALDGAAGWIQARLDETLRRWDARASLRTQAERAAAPRPGPSGILLVSSDPELILEVSEALAGAQDVRAVPPVMAPYRDAVELQPPYLVVVPCSGSLDECHHLKALLDKVPPRCPLVVMNLSAQQDAVRAFAQEVKATLSTDRPRRRFVFFRRLVVGLIRRHWGTPGVGMAQGSASPVAEVPDLPPVSSAGSADGG
jgi:hypothetical protein